MIRNNKIFTATSMINNEMISIGLYDFTLNEALKYAIKDIDILYENGDYNYSTIEEFLKEEEVEIHVDVISCNRIMFESSEELKEYFNNNIDKIPNDQLYDFLLSLSDHETRIYDYNGNLLESDITLHPNHNDVLGYDVNFTEESCSKGEYIFRIII